MSSWRTAALSNEEFALLNPKGSKPARRRTTCARSNSEFSMLALTLYIWRLIEFRVTALLAHRLGTIAPSHTSCEGNKTGPA